MDLATSAAITRLDSGRPDLLAFDIHAKIAKPDIEWMAAQVDQAFEAQERIDMLLIMTHYDGADLGAVFDGYAMEVQGRSLKHVRRYAVAGAPAWARVMIELFDPLSPVEAKTFDLEDKDAAWAWVNAADD